LVCFVQFRFRFWLIYRDKKVVGVFVRFSYDYVFDDAFFFCILYK
jgi:hypothetical protein